MKHRAALFINFNLYFRHFTDSNVVAATTTMNLSTRRPTRHEDSSSTRTTGKKNVLTHSERHKRYPSISVSASIALFYNKKSLPGIHEHFRTHHQTDCSSLIAEEDDADCLSHGLFNQHQSVPRFNLRDVARPTCACICPRFQTASHPEHVPSVPPSPAQPQILQREKSESEVCRNLLDDQFLL